MKLRYFILCFFMCFNLFSQEIDSRYVLSGGVAHIGNGEVIENSTIIIDKGKIVAIGPACNYNASATFDDESCNYARKKSSQYRYKKKCN